MKYPGYTKFSDNYSRGCQLCQEGRWLCIYLTYLCNAKCSFCPVPFRNVDKVVSAFGDDPALIFKRIKGIDFTGISFSGGDCFLVFDRLLEWLSYFKKLLPKVYYWAYTNGLTVDEQKLQQLADAGLDELRFNIAASNYNSAAALKAIAIATRIIHHVAVEIPSIPGDYEKLVEILPYLDSVHVKYLNLHEYLLVQDDPHTATAVTGTFILNKDAKLKYDAHSLQNTERIKAFCKRNSLKIKINSCSLQKKEVQMLHRRLSMGSILKKEFEYLTEDGLLETYLVYPAKLQDSELQVLLHKNGDLSHIEKYFIHPAVFKKNNRKAMGSIAKLAFLPPLGVDDKRKLLRVEVAEQQGIHCTG